MPGRRKVGCEVWVFIIRRLGFGLWDFRGVSPYDSEISFNGIPEDDKHKSAKFIINSFLSYEIKGR
jgi:hypothetical protein